ncbi:DUF2975 domain-containing protein [uncultured Tenacibaculum sp.]|uniref:DUF2975 domain-containing protein n=1 Tax=uncultured Tenacibaculum sp. TaxID=174713 RepID=UPI00260F9322|nr:DUF2975 domain-containing protein [uncultured Tenacibaculum sp.]
MKKVLSVLKWFCSLLVVSAGINFFERMYKLMHYTIYGGSKAKVFKLSIPEDWNDNYYYSLSFIVLILMGYLIYLIVEFRRVIFNFSKENVFTKENSDRLRKVGRGLMIYAAVVLCFAIVLGLIIEREPSINADSTLPGKIGYTFGYIIGTAISKVLPILVVALFVQFISFLVVKGSVLQEENNLTI